MRALIVTDLQNDFLPGGALPVPDGDAILPVVNCLQREFELVVATQDWHPPDHVSFASVHPGRIVGETIEVEGRPQELWPVHCVAGTPGAELTDGLDTSRIAHRVRKGTDRDVDSYSAFRDNAGKRETGLDRYLRSRDVETLYICGVATEFCVRHTALHAVELGYETYVVRDACRGVELAEGDTARALEEVREAGGHVVVSDEVFQQASDGAAHNRPGAKSNSRSAGGGGDNACQVAPRNSRATGQAGQGYPGNSRIMGARRRRDIGGARAGSGGYVGMIHSPFPRRRTMRTSTWLATAGITMLAMAGSAVAERVTVDGAQRHQTIEGFGTSLIGWKDDIHAIYETASFQRAFVEQMGLNFVRVNMDGIALPEQNLPAPPGELEPEDISHEDFDKEHKRVASFVNFARAARKLNPDLKVIGSVWSPPGWMKHNNSMTDDAGSKSIQIGDSYERDGVVLDNRVRREFYNHYAAYLLEWVKWYDEQGVGFYALSIANEPMFTQTFGSCVWTASDYADMVGLLGPRLEEAGYGDILLFGPETMTHAHNQSYDDPNWLGGNPLYLKELMEHPQASQYFDVFATHGYEDGVRPDENPENVMDVRRMIDPHGLDLWITEGGTGGHDWPAPVTGGIANRIHTAFVHGNVNAFVPWQVTDNYYYQGALMKDDEMTDKSYAFQQYARFIEDGAVRLEVTPAETEIATSAYVHDENGTLTVVLLNHGESDEVRHLRLANLEVVDGKSHAQVYRTSAEEHMRRLDDAEIEEGEVTVEVPALSVVTVYVE